MFIQLIPSCMRSKSTETFSCRDFFSFFRAWIRSPRSIAAIAPSGRALAELITRSIDQDTGPILELGSGTGVFAQALLRQGVPEANLTLIESEPGLADILRQRFPGASVIRMDASKLEGQTLGNDRPFGAVVCGLGLLNMEQGQVEAVLIGALSLSHPHASFFLFTYGRRCSVPDETLMRLGLAAVRIGATWCNIPPASVYEIRRISV